MRFGKKLALMMEDSAYRGDERPFLSHRALKDNLSNAVRMVRTGSSPGESLEQFKETMKQDHGRISSRLRSEELQLSDELDLLMEEARRLGIVDTESTLHLVSSIQNVFLAPCPALHACVSDGLRSVWFNLTVEVARFADKLNGLLHRTQSWLAYADLNVAGFRKLRKQYEKQIPEEWKISVLGVDEYRDLVLELVHLSGRVDLLRCKVDTMIQTLSPGTEPLLALRLGSESLLAVSHTDGTGKPSSEIKGAMTQSTSLSPTHTPNAVEKNGADILTVLRRSGIDVEELGSRLLAL